MRKRRLGRYNETKTFESDAAFPVCREAEVSGRRYIVAVEITEGKFDRVWSWILPLLTGLAFGWFCMVCLAGWLEGNIRRQRPVAVATVAAVPAEEAGMRNMTVFLETNPFKITPMPVMDNASFDVSGDSYVPITGDLATAVLKWPIPGVGVVIESQGKQHWVLVNGSFDVYALERVNRLQAIFRRGDERVVKDLFYINTPAPLKKTGSSSPAAASSGTSGASVSAAEAGGKEGAISSELVQKLMENPFDELKNVRLRPKDGEQGLQIQWINKDSILSQLGVQKGDVIRAINGIPFRNMADITNSMNSLLNSERFDVEVVRDGKPASLKYVVR